MYYNQKIARTAKLLLRRCGYQTPQYREVTELTSLLPKNKNESMFSLATEAYQSLERGGIHSSHIMLYLEQQEKQGSNFYIRICVGF